MALCIPWLRYFFPHFIWVKRLSLHINMSHSSMLCLHSHVFLSLLFILSSSLSFKCNLDLLFHSCTKLTEVNRMYWINSGTISSLIVLNFISLVLFHDHLRITDAIGMDILKSFKFYLIILNLLKLFLINHFKIIHKYWFDVN